MDIGQFITGKYFEQVESITQHGIPFEVARQDGLVRAVPYVIGHPNDWPAQSIRLDGVCQCLFLLGMTTEKPEGSEWWGQSERYHYQGKRLFIGDRLGAIWILYADNTAETIPVIFGVNAWPYELINPLKTYEQGHLNNYWGPYPEPFASDAHARRLLEQSLVLMENDAEKGMKYILGIKVKEKLLRGVAFAKAEYKEAGFVVSAATGVKPGAPLNLAWKVVSPDFFLQKAYYPTMDRLARRLYQFADEIPGAVALAMPEGYAGPKVTFKGSGVADIFTNVYLHNLHDIATDKVDETGLSHTSSRKAPSFGSYVGFGTYREDVGSYYGHMWSRDVGRELIELIQAGENERTYKAAAVQAKYLYDRSVRFMQPHWKRISNGSELGEDLLKSLAGKENDGHGAIMLFYYVLFARGVIDVDWLRANRKVLQDAVNWIAWQVENPAESNFDRVLYSESEASTQTYGGYDLFSNTMVFYALKGFVRLAQAAQYIPLADQCRGLSALLWEGINARFVGDHPRYGRIFTDTTDDCWTWEYKRFAPLFLLADTDTYDPARFDPALFSLCQNTYQAQKEDYFAYAAGRQMGYGQGYLTETCILLDEYADFTGCIEQAAKFSYHHSDHNYIVPEGVIMHPSGGFWFRNCDLGNAVQQGEIVKCARLLIGLDDLDAHRGLSLIPRLPDTWNSISAEDYVVMAQTLNGPQRLPVTMRFERVEGGYKLDLDALQPLLLNQVRIGPFDSASGDFVVQGARQFDVEDRAGRLFVYVPVQASLKQLRLTVRRSPRW